MLKKTQNFPEKGQTLVIVVISLFVFIAFLALAIDGGNTWAQRRTAQAAADAAALAGTQVVCETRSWLKAVDAAEEYALERNGATAIDPPTAILGSESAIIGMEVTAHVQFKTFFAQLLGRPEIDAQAIAKAQCFAPAGGSVLPIAWSCRSSLANLGTPIPTLDPDDKIKCQRSQVPLSEWNNEANGIKLGTVYDSRLFIVMDSETMNIEVYCEGEDPPVDDLGTPIASEPINCDLDGDGKADVFVGQSARSWLNLDGSAGSANDLKSWIDGSKKTIIRTHTWLPAISGEIASVYHAAAEFMQHQIVYIPIFDALCKANNFDPDCLYLMDHDWMEDTTGISPDDYPDDVEEAAGNATYHHIYAIGAFGVSCVNAQGGKYSRNDCPGWQVFMANNPSIKGKGQYNSIEGYFISGVASGDGSTAPVDLDTGVFVVKLIE